MKKRILIVSISVLLLLFAVACSSKTISTPDWLQGTWTNSSNDNETLTITEDNVVINSFGSVAFDANALLTTYENAGIDQEYSDNSNNLTIINKDSGMGMVLGFLLDETTDVLSLTFGGQTYTFSR